MKQKTKETIINLAVGLTVLIIIIWVAVIAIDQMGVRIYSDCEKQNFQGMHPYWDADVDCSKINFYMNNTSYNVT